MRKARVEIDLNVLGGNIRAFREAVDPDTEIIFVVKGDAYNHGAIEIARRAARESIRWFAVAYVEEALALRSALKEEGILVLGGSEPEDVPVLARERITPVVISLEHGLSLGKAARASGVRLPVHIKIDTGMGRLGLLSDDAPAHYRALLAEEGLDIRGLCSHFATVEPDQPLAAEEQLARFRAFEAERKAIDPRELMLHLSSSRAALYFDAWDFNAVRPGIALYGYGAEDEKMRAHTRPVLQWKAYAMQVKRVPPGFAVGYYSTYTTTEPTVLVTVSVGYADGFLRTMSNRGIVLIRGKRCRVVGRVSMNWITVDAGPEAEVEAGDEVVLLGRQGEEEIWAGELARLCRTIPYEILTNINPRTPRTYVG